MQKISNLTRFKCGIYCISNLSNGKRYVGSSVNIYNRLHEHLHNLTNNKAHNKHLLSAWNKYGKESFDFSVLEYCDESIRFDREQYYIDALKPEYNLELQVVANFGHSPSKESRKKISETLKKKYRRGEIVTYKQEHAWIPCSIYLISDYSLVQSFKNIADAIRYLNYGHSSVNAFRETIIYEKYCIVIDQDLQDSGLNIKDFLTKNYYKCLGKDKYLISEDDFGNLKYHKSIAECARYTGVARSTILKHPNMSIENPYCPKKFNLKLYYSNNYILQDGAVQDEESLELLQTKIGKDCNVNTEVISEIAKGLETPLSVVSE